MADGVTREVMAIVNSNFPGVTDWPTRKSGQDIIVNKIAISSDDFLSMVGHGYECGSRISRSTRVT